MIFDSQQQADNLEDSCNRSDRAEFGSDFSPRQHCNADGMDAAENQNDQEAHQNQNFEQPEEQPGEEEKKDNGGVNLIALKQEQPGSNDENRPEIVIVNAVINGQGAAAASE